MESGTSTGPDSGAGQNAQGKSSVLDVIVSALGGKELCPEVPIRQGETEARAFLDLGDLKVTRRWWFKESGELTSDLRVETAEGARFSKGQEAASALLGRLSFDPLEFTRWKPDAQYRALRAFVPDFDFEENAGLRKAAYDERTDVSREAQRLKIEAAAVEPLPELAAFLGRSGLMPAPGGLGGFDMDEGAPAGFESAVVPIVCH